MKQIIIHIAVVVKDYDEAIAFYTEKLHFTLIEDIYQPAQDKRWVVVSPTPPAVRAAGRHAVLAQSTGQELVQPRRRGLDGAYGRRLQLKPAGSEYSHPTYGAHLEAIDGVGSPWYFNGDPTIYWGDISSFYGGTLTYQFRWKANEVSECRLRGKHDYYYQDLWKPDVAIYGRNQDALGYFSPDPPDTYVGGLLYYNDCKEYSVPIAAQYGTIGSYKFGWMKYCVDRPHCYNAATQDEILSVLKDVAYIGIRGEYCFGSADRGMLDEVTLKAP